MKNLKISHENAVTDQKTISLLKDAVKMCVDANDELLFAVLKNGRIIAIDKNMNLVDEIEHSTKLCGGEEMASNRPIVGFDYLFDEQQLCLVLADGRLFTCSTSSKELNCVMELKRTVRGSAWSPELHLLIVATDANLLMISREFNVVAEAPLRPTTAGKDQLLTIGWGSAETQFQGSVGKQNVHNKQQDQNRLPISIREAFDDKRVAISWRGDAQFFAVSSVDEVLVPKQQTDSPSKNMAFDKLLCRQLRVWDRDLDFMSQCEFLAGTEAAVCMRSKNNLIAVPAVSPTMDRHIWFYERNGQIRNKFKLEASSMPSTSNSNCVTAAGGHLLFAHSVVRHLAWNLDGTVMAIYYENTLDKAFQLQFWTVSNYSWTEKLRISVDELVDVLWDPENDHKLHCLTKAGVYRKIVLRSEFSCEDMIVVSINGDRVRVTDFKYAPIPPPMCHYELHLDFIGTPSAFAHCAIFGLAFVSSDFMRVSTFSLQNRRFVRGKNVAVAAAQQSLRLLLNLIWRNANALLAFRKCEQTAAGTDNKSYELVELHLDPLTISPPLRAFDILPFAHSLISSAIDRLPTWWLPDEENCVRITQVNIDNADGEDAKWLLTLEEETAAAAGKFYGNGASIKTVELDRNCSLVFYSNARHQLFVNGKLLCTKVLSFCCTKEFLVLVFWGEGYSLFCLPIDWVLKFVMSGDKQLITETFACPRTGRKVEWGAEVITNEPNGTRVWLQLPRGNLEVVHPRPILLERLKCWLDAREWCKAFFEMRRHRVDLNLLYDHNPKAFNDSIEQFVAQINDVESLSVFLTSLKDMDTTLRMFAPFYPERQQQQLRDSDFSIINKFKKQIQQFKQAGKVNDICERIRSHLLGLNDEDTDRFTRLYPIILCSYALETPNRVPAALANMCTQITKMSTNEEEQFHLIRQWIKHLSHLASESLLFKEALKTYDLEIALRDPQEYRPVLNDLRQKTPPAYQKYHIHLYLEEWHSALEHIAMLAQMEGEGDDGDVAENIVVDDGDGAAKSSTPYLDECLKLISQNILLQPSALKLFCGRPHYKKICEIAAKELEKKDRFREAAILHEKASDFAAALQCHLKMLNFLDYCRLSKLQPQSDEKTKNELRKMGTQMMSKNDYLAAVEVFSYLGKQDNFEKILECYEKANAWNKLSTFVAENRHSIHGIFNRVQVLLSTRCAQIHEQVDGWRDTIAKHTKRLDILREEKREKIARMAQGKQADGDGDDKLDAFSESSMTSSSFSGTTFAFSSSNTNDTRSCRSGKLHKMERKKLTIKEGSRWEDHALLVALHEIHQRIDAQQDELVELLPALLSMDLVERASRLQKEMLIFLACVEDNQSRIWPTHLEAWHLPGPLAELYPEAPLTPSEMPRKIELTSILVSPKMRPTGAEWKLAVIE